MISMGYFKKLKEEVSEKGYLVNSAMWIGSMPVMAGVTAGGEHGALIYGTYTAIAATWLGLNTFINSNEKKNREKQGGLEKVVKG